MSNLGQANEAKDAAPVVAKPGRASRFFFHLDSEIEEKRRKAFAPKVLVHEDAHLVKTLTAYKPKATKMVEARINQVRAFFLEEIAPILMSASAGSKQAHDVVERLIDGKVDKTLSGNFDAMVVKAARIKLAAFVVDLFDLPQAAVDDLLGPKAEPERKLTTVLEDLVQMVSVQSQNLNVLTNEVTSFKQRLPKKAT